ALGTWAAREPRAAIGRIDTNLTGPIKEEALVTATMKWASSDPDAAAAWFPASGSASESVLTGLVNSWADLDPRAAAKWIDTVKDDRKKILRGMRLGPEWSDSECAA